MRSFCTRVFAVINYVKSRRKNATFVKLEQNMEEYIQKEGIINNAYKASKRFKKREIG